MVIEAAHAYREWRDTGRPMVRDRDANRHRRAEHDYRTKYFDFAAGFLTGTAVGARP
jgi:hypothetical protein